MRLARVRSGLSESFDEVATIAIDSHGKTLFSSGPVAREMYYRSSIKPFQAIAAERLGLRLSMEHLAVSCASHGGYPVHLAIVERILSDHGLSITDLGCPPGRPLSREADLYRAQSGSVAPEPLLHNCSGKHAAWLAACVLSGHDTGSYLDLRHPLQESILDVVKEYSGVDGRPVGVDGCGAPTLRGTVITLASAFARLTTEPEASRVTTAMTRYPALVADNMRPDGRVGMTWGGPVKIGAEGSFVMAKHGIAIATKSESGTSAMAVAAGLHVAEQIGMLPDGVVAGLRDEISPPVVGGGRQVGRTIEVDTS